VGAEVLVPVVVAGLAPVVVAGLAPVVVGLAAPAGLADAAGLAAGLGFVVSFGLSAFKTAKGTHSSAARAKLIDLRITALLN
jgi:hypothetical protein